MKVKVPSPVQLMNHLMKFSAHINTTGAHNIYFDSFAKTLVMMATAGE
jgi:hypothetical protein